MRLLLLLSPILCNFLVYAQTWESGDNSTVKGCSSHCSMTDSDLSCWNTTLEFFEKILIGQLRHYISVQIDIDQWWRRHGKKEGQDFDEVKKNAAARMKALLKPKDEILDEAVVVNVTSLLIDRVSAVSFKTLSFVPHFECPLPCEYRHDMYRNLLIASALLNICLACSVFPMLRKLRRQSQRNQLLLDGSS